MIEPKVGIPLEKQKAVVVDVAEETTDGRKEYVVLCLLWSNKVTPYVVWYAYLDKDLGIQCTNGDYCFTLEDAVMAFNKRKAKTNKGNQ